MLFTDMSAELPVFTIAGRDRDHAPRRGIRSRAYLPISKMAGSVTAAMRDPRDVFEMIEEDLRARLAVPVVGESK